MRHWAKFMAAAAGAMFVVLSTAIADEPSKCAAAPHLLWGDGEHDDTAALNAWLQGETVIWAQTHDAVGEEIADRTFLLSSAIYISSGTGRKLVRFRMVWPERKETVSGGAIVAGSLVAGSIPLFIGLVVVVPVLGHATWHLYRKLVVV